MVSDDVRVAIDSSAELGEGPRWDAAGRRLLWVDIEGRLVHVGDRAIDVGARVGAVAPTTNGNVLVALADRLAILDLGDESLQTLAELPHGARLRTNDGACDPAGRFWIGTLELDFAPGAGALYRLEAGRLERVLDGLTLSNGIGWSPDASLMYFIDSRTFRVDVFDYEAGSGAIAGRRAFVATDPADGTPDGLAVDDDGGVWVAFYGGSALRRYHADGTIDQVLRVPAENVTACCFGGDDGRSLFITSAAPDGRVFVTDVAVGGPPAVPYVE